MVSNGLGWCQEVGVMWLGVETRDEVGVLKCYGVENRSGEG